MSASSVHGFFTVPGNVNEVRLRTEERPKVLGSLLVEQSRKSQTDRLGIGFRAASSLRLFEESGIYINGFFHTPIMPRRLNRLP